ncbi:hypothetical protein [Rhodococcoides fascians]|uniref:hypothetical protein n=1 Tax=Rhodococcoides fascians TaxID=1828 RepID=UPI000567B21B|nr:hypothetical protein [Rhodococcus fascians]
MDEPTVRTELRRLRDARAELVQQITAIDEERSAVVLAGFEAGLSASAMTDDAGLSQQRLSQIKRGGRT